MKHGRFSGPTFIGASGLVSIRADSRDEAIVKTLEFLTVVGDGECEVPG